MFIAKRKRQTSEVRTEMWQDMQSEPVVTVHLPWTMIFFRVPVH